MKTVTWKFHTPTRLVFGEGVSGTIGDEIRQIGCSSPMLVADKGLSDAGLVGRVRAHLDDAKINVTVFDGVEANPSSENVHAGVEHAKKNSCDSVIALGGGSPIDVAKAIAILSVHDGAITDYEIGKQEFARHGLPLITIPTTSGTGSEVTWWSVITDPITHRKFDVGTPLMAAIAALDDPELTYGLPAPITGATGMDALTHAIEAFTTRNAGPHTDALAFQAIALIGKHLKTAFSEPGNREARRMMMLASATAGLAFPNAGLGAVHGLTAPIGGHLGVPHGQANAALLPFVMEFNMPACIDKYAAIAMHWGEDHDCSDKEALAERAINMVKDMLKVFEIPALSDMGVTIENIPALAKDSMGKFSNNNSNPLSVTQEDAEKILTRAIEPIGAAAASSDNKSTVK